MVLDGFIFVELFVMVFVFFEMFMVLYDDIIEFFEMKYE